TQVHDHEQLNHLPTSRTRGPVRLEATGRSGTARSHEQTDKWCRVSVSLSWRPCPSMTTTRTERSRMSVRELRESSRRVRIPAEPFKRERRGIRWALDLPPSLPSRALRQHSVLWRLPRPRRRRVV